MVANIIELFNVIIFDHIHEFFLGKYALYKLKFNHFEPLPKLNAVTFVEKKTQTIWMCRRKEGDGLSWMEMRGMKSSSLSCQTHKSGSHSHGKCHSRKEAARSCEEPAKNRSRNSFQVPFTFLSSIVYFLGVARSCLTSFCRCRGVAAQVSAPRQANPAKLRKAKLNDEVAHSSFRVSRRDFFFHSIINLLFLFLFLHNCSQCLPTGQSKWVCGVKSACQYGTFSLGIKSFSVSLNPSH